jgi:hypothetical protein
MKEKLSFIKIAPYKHMKRRHNPLSKEEAIYWKRYLPKVLRAAVELEYNLNPSRNSTCLIPRRVDKCLCVDFINGSCEALCINKECEFYKEDGCGRSVCFDYIRPCDTCTSFKIDCDVCKQKAVGSTSVSSDNQRQRIQRILQPKNSVNHASGVHQVITDGSLWGTGGVEITTIGQIIDYHNLHKLFKNIMTTVQKYGGWVDERTSIHVHLLSQYIPNSGMTRKEDRMLDVFFNSLEKPIPEEVMVNFHQLLRRFEHVLLWMFSTGDSIYNLTRWEKFRQPIFEIGTPLISGMYNMRDLLEKHCKKVVRKNKYSTFNYFYSQLDPGGLISSLHLEARFADGSFSPAAVASLCCLMSALLLKAVDISKYGLLSVGSEGTINEIIEIRKALLNHNASYDAPRLSDTIGVFKYKDKFISDSKEMVSFLESYLPEEAFTVLMNLAKEPIALKRALRHLTWDEINKELEPFEPINTEDAFDDIMEAIDLSHILDVDSEKDWIAEAVNVLDLPADVIQESISTLTEQGIIKWSAKSRAYQRV